MDILKIIRSGPATVLFWSDGTKTVVKRKADQEDDFEAAVAAAVFKRACGNTRNRVLIEIAELQALTVVKQAGRVDARNAIESAKKQQEVVQIAHESAQKQQEVVQEQQENAQKQQEVVQESFPRRPAAQKPSPRKAPSVSGGGRIDTGKMMALADAGWTLAEISEELHTCKSNLSRIFRDHAGMGFREYQKVNLIREKPKSDKEFYWQ